MSKTGHLTAEDWDHIRAKHAAMTPEEARAWIRSVMGPPHKTLEGDDKEKVMLLLAMTEPYKETNNQHSWTAYYNIGGKEYHATYFPEDKDGPIIDEMLTEEE